MARKSKIVLFLKANRHPLSVLLLVLLLIFGYFFTFARHFPLENLKLKTADGVLHLRSYYQDLPSSLDKVVLVGIDADTMKIVNRKWPWDHDIMAVFIKKILENDPPKVIAFDMVFSDHHNRYKQLLTEWIAKSKRTFLATYFSSTGEHILPPSEYMQASRGIGSVTKPIDRDGTLRRTRLFTSSKSGEIVAHALSFKVAASYLSDGDFYLRYDADRQKLRAFNAGNETIISAPTSRYETCIINYRVADHQVKEIPFWRIILGKAEPGIFKDKIVILAVTNPILHDIHLSALGNMKGANVVINETLMFLDNLYLEPVSIRLIALISIVLSIAIIFLIFKRGFFIGLMFTLLALAILFFGTLFLAMENILWDLFGSLFFILTAFSSAGIINSVSIAVENATLRRLAITDALTDLYIFRYLNVRLPYETKKALEANSELSLIMADIDNFKKINDTYGHDAGNEVLKALAKIFKGRIRKTDTAVRYGGEEFCLILPNTPLGGAIQVAKSLRQMFALIDIICEGVVFKATASFGVATLSRLTEKNAEALLRAADQALYEAKKTGKNRVCS